MKAVNRIQFVYLIYMIPDLTQGNGYTGGYPDYNNNYYRYYQGGGYHQNQIQDDSGFSGYSYPVPRIPFRYPEEFERKYGYTGSNRERVKTEQRDERVTIDRTTNRDQEDQDRRDRDRNIKDRNDRDRELKDRENREREDRKRLEEERHRNREEDSRRERERKEERRQREELAERIKIEEEKVKEKARELEEREERILRERQELEVARQRDQRLRDLLVDQLVAEHRNRTLESLEQFGQNLKENQRLEDEAREMGKSQSERTFKFTEEREEIIRRGGQPPVVNRSRNTTFGSGSPEDGTTGGSSRSRFESESSFRQSSSNRGGTDTGRRPDDNSPDLVGGSRSRFESESSSRQSSSGGPGAPVDDTSGSTRTGSSRSSSSRSSSSSSRSSSSLDNASSGSALIPFRERFSSFFNTKRSVPPIANDPEVLTVATRDEVLEKTGALHSSSRQFNACPVGSVFSLGQRRCIKWG